MKLEIQKDSTEIQRIPVRLGRIHKGLVRAAGVVAGVGLAAGGAHALVEANTTHFEGENTVQIDESTVTDIAMNHVDGAENDIRSTVNEIVERNPDVFQNGKAVVESDDVGKTISVPGSAEK